ncbi:MAG: flagellar filament capping protein FliD [Proteobacteria bacterium]|nr:flagellar filament capping protein FliD [Pseudomonadota bacterium]
MSVEQQPLIDLNTKEAGYQAKLTAVGNIKSALSQFQSAVQSLSDISKFQSSKATTADSTIASATASASATPGSYALEVIKLAQTQKLASVGQSSATDPVGNGTITFDFGTVSGGSFDSGTGKYTGASFTSNGSGVKTVTIDSSNNSLSGIRDAINSANIGVTASIVNDGSASPYRLVLTDTATGKTNSMQISVSGDAALGTLMNHDPAAAPAGQGFSETQTAQNAQFNLDGVAITKTSNTVTDVIQGVTLNLAKTNAGSPTTVSVSRDTGSVTAAVNQFVLAYNQINKTLKDLSAYDPSTKTAAILNGDAAVRTIQTQLRGVLSNAITGSSGAFSRLSDIGVAIQKDGTLGLDSSKLQNAINSNFSDVAGVFAAVGKASDSLVSVTGSSSKTTPGSYALNITQLATQGKSVGQAAAGLTIDSSNDTLQIQVDGITTTVTLTHATYVDAATLAAEVQARINGAGALSSAGSAVSVSQSGGVLTISSNRYGSASNASITGGNGMTNLIGAGQTTSAGVDVAGTINGFAASGSGQTLTGAIGSVVDGLKLQITGGALGNRGTVNFSRGYANMFDTLASSLLGTNGPLSSKTDSINATIKDIEGQKSALNNRLADIEARYRAQFTALDVAIGQMQQTSAYLTQQLANLPKISSS